MSEHLILGTSVPIVMGKRKKAAPEGRLERVMVGEGLSLELPPEDPDADEAGAEQEEGGGFGDGFRRF